MAKINEEIEYRIERENYEAINDMKKQVKIQFLINFIYSKPHIK